MDLNKNQITRIEDIANIAYTKADDNGKMCIHLLFKELAIIFQESDEDGMFSYNSFMNNCKHLSSNPKTK